MTMLNSRTYDEKRDFIRMQVDTEIILTVDETNEKLSGYCRDLSGTGMLIEVNKEVAEGLNCQTTLASNNPAFPSLDANIKVLRCTPIGDDKFQLGTEIVHIDN